MAIVVEDGTGNPTAESYAAVSDFDAYHTRFGNSSLVALSTPVKELALKKATQFLDLVYGPQYLGSRTTIGQALGFPRDGILDRDGYIIARDTVPAKLIYATCEAAGVATSSDLMPDISADDSGSLVDESLTVGPITISERFAGGKSITNQLRKVEGYLVDLARSDAGCERG